MPFLVLVFAAACSGCGLSTGAAISSAAGAAPVVVDGLDTNRPDTFWVARYDDVLAAAKRAGEKLSLELVRERIEENDATLRYEDRLEDQVILRIERRSDSVTRVRFVAVSSDVRGMAALLGRQIVAELRDADAFLVDWANDRQGKSQ